MGDGNPVSRIDYSRLMSLNARRITRALSADGFRLVRQHQKGRAAHSR